jgi:hypothetical protein
LIPAIGAFFKQNVQTEHEINEWDKQKEGIPPGLVKIMQTLNGLQPACDHRGQGDRDK